MKDLSRLLLLIGTLAVLQVIAIVTAPLLAGEAYYWLWGRYPAAGYFDHPPMVAWMARLFFGWVNGSPLAARSSAVILGMLTTPAVYGVARTLYPEGRIAWRAALLYAVTPLFHGLGITIMPDNALLLFMSLTWLCFWKASRPKGGFGWWILSGITAGCALLSKFHAWVMLPPLYLFLLLTPEGRARLKSPWPWIAILIALAVLSPNLIWNARHQWINYTYQWRRSDIPEFEFEIENPLIFMLGPAFSLSPVVYALILGAIWKGIRLWRTDRDQRILYLLCAGIPLPLLLGLLSIGVTISLHWPGGGYIPLIILAVALVEQGAFKLKGLYRMALVPAVTITALLHVGLQLVNVIPSEIYAPFRSDEVNTTRLKAEWTGWPDIGRVARNLLDEANKSEPTVLMARDWHLASSIAFYSERPTEVFPYKAYDAHNYRFWMQDRDMLKGMNAIVFIQKSKPQQVHLTLERKMDKYIDELEDVFKEVRPLPSLIIYTDGSIERYEGVSLERPRYREFLVLEGRGFRGKFRD